jgi:hypothetical protein
MSHRLLCSSSRSHRNFWGIFASRICANLWRKITFTGTLIHVIERNVDILYLTVSLPHTRVVFADDFSASGGLPVSPQIRESSFESSCLDKTVQSFSVNVNHAELRRIWQRKIMVSCKVSYLWLQNSIGMTQLRKILPILWPRPYVHWHVVSEITVIPVFVWMLLEANSVFILSYYCLHHSLLLTLIYSRLYYANFPQLQYL